MKMAGIWIFLHHTSDSSWGNIEVKKYVNNTFKKYIGFPLCLNIIWVSIIYQFDICELSFRVFIWKFYHISGARSIREEVKAHAGGEVILPCSINKDECGDFHSIKWYKENRRVFVYSPIADFAKAEGDLLDR